MKFVGVLVLPAAIVLGLVYVESRVLDPSPPHPRTRGVVWAGRTFVDRAQLARWLRSRGFSYRVWAVRHPELSGVKPRPDARAANATPADRGSTWISAKLAGALALLALVVLVVVTRGRRLIRWLGRTVSAFPRPPGTRGVALRRRIERPALPSFFKLSRARGIVAAVAAVGPRLGPTLSAAAARARRPSLRLGGSVGRMLTAQAAFMAFTFRRKRTQLGWYLATMFLAAGTGLLVAAWLNAA